MKRLIINHIYLFTAVLLIAPAALGTLTDLTHYEDTLDLGNDNFITVVSDVEYDSVNNWNIFDYKIQNNSGDTLYQISQIGEDWAGGGGLNLSWSVDITDSPILNQDFIKFYDSLLDDGTDEELITGSNFLSSWGIREMELKGNAGTYNLNVLAPEAVPEPATISIITFGAAILASAKRKKK